MTQGRPREVIRTESVTKTYNVGKPNEAFAVRSVSVSILENDFAVLKGPSGSGKTTLLSLIGCMARPTSGSITVEGKDVSHLPERFLTNIRRRIFGFIFQQFNLIQGMTVLQNVLIPLLPTDSNPADGLKKAEAILEDLDMLKRRDFPVNSLSGGEQQRVAIARALINDPAIILADEPTAHLDTALAADFMKIMHHLRDQGRTVVIASHDPVVFEDSRISQVVSMRDGRSLGIQRNV
ncbi:MAG: ABC transporter ATP-binding protein [Thermodesulfovibrio sp.]|nr:ABC transporter ATP-binding protein [Thermodesulfovibrio sp.]